MTLTVPGPGTVVVHGTLSLTLTNTNPGNAVFIGVVRDTPPGPSPCNPDTGSETVQEIPAANQLIGIQQTVPIERIFEVAAAGPQTYRIFGDADPNGTADSRRFTATFYPG